MADALVRVAPFNYIHILDSNSNTQRVEVGPQTFSRQDHESIVLGPLPMVIIPPRYYCIIADPYVRQEGSSEPSVDKYGQVLLRHGDREIRFAEEWKDPFALLPGEKLVGSVTPLMVVQADTALRLVARRDFSDAKDGNKVAGDEWLFQGPGTYRPRIEVDILETISAVVIQPDHALKLQARNQFTDRNGVERKAGEEWLVRNRGAYLPHVEEKIVASVAPRFLTQSRALHLRAADGYTDVYGTQRKAGQEWLVTANMSEAHLQDIHEEIVGEVSRITVTKAQYCLVMDPVGADGNNQLGARELRQGECSFFLLPGEKLEGGLENVHVLGCDEALLLEATEKFAEEVEGKEVVRAPGDRWMIRGPRSYTPRVEVQIVETRRTIPLDENEGIYVRDTTTGKVRSVSGETYMLKSHEELWEKELSKEVDDLLEWSYNANNKDKSGPSTPRDRTRVVNYRVPHNAAVQLYDYNTKQLRVVFGPGLVMLEPDEQFSVISLSGDKPKRPNVIRSLSLMLGPDFMTDIVEVETSDHARLRIQLSYNWQFLSTKDKDPQKIFQVRDFVGDACKAIASRVRGAVAIHPFDAFHKNSARIIRQAVFGVDETQKIFLFNANNLAITNIDIQSVEPVDERTRESLQKSVQLAIEITTKKQERNARHIASKIEQDAKGKIEKQKIVNSKGVEEERQELSRLQAMSAAVASTGTAKAEAEAKAEFHEIEANADVKQAELQSLAASIEAKSELEETISNQQLEVEHKRALAALELNRNNELANIETEKFRSLVSSIKPETIKAIARSGPELQARLLKGLGLKGYLMTDGNSPVNLFDAAKGMVNPNMGGVSGMPSMQPMPK